MAIDTAEKRRSVAGLPFFIFLGVTPNAAKDSEWRQQSGWGYSGIAVSVATLSSVFGYNPFVIRTPMTDTFREGGLGVNNLAIFPRAIFWDNPGAAGHKVIVKESPTGSILFEATARAQYASQYWRPNRMKKGHPRGGVRWQDFIVTQIDSGDLYIWY